MTATTPPLHWDDRVAAAVAWAEIDHDLGDRPRPRLLGYLADECIVVIDLRPFPRGGADRPVLEATAALLAIGCDGIVAALPGRAWSVDDPVPPVADDLDLRQPVVAVHAARRGRPAETWLLPHRRAADALTWLAVRRMPGRPDGTIPTLIELGVQHGIDATTEEAAEQLARCSRLGHEVMLVEGAVAPGTGRHGLR